MAETASVVATLVVVAGVVGGVPLAAFAGPTDHAQVATNGTNASVAPGERLAGTVGVQEAAIEGEMASRTFGQRVAAAASNDSRAEILGAEVEDLQARLDELEAERAELERAYENGTVSRGEYRARLAQLYAEKRALQRLANRTQQVAEQLPAETLRANGVNVSAIRALKNRAANLTGPEVAEIARSIAGRGAGGGFGPEKAGPPAFANGSERGPPGDGGPPENAGGDGPPADRNKSGQQTDSGAPANGQGASDRRGNGTNGGAGDAPADQGNETRSDGTSDGTTDGSDRAGESSTDGEQAA